MSGVYKHYIGPSAILYFMSKIKLFPPCVLALLHECTRAFEQIVCYGAVRLAILATARLLVLNPTTASRNLARNLTRARFLKDGWMLVLPEAALKRSPSLMRINFGRLTSLM